MARDDLERTYPAKATLGFERNPKGVCMRD